MTAGPAAPAPAPARAGSPGTDGGPAAGDAGPEATPDAARRARLRRWGWPLAIAAVVLLTALVTTALLPDTSRGALDPRSAEPDGARAVAQILRAQGVTVDVVERSAAAVSGATRDTTVVVVHPSLLGPVQLQRLADSAADLVLVEPNLVVLDELAPALTPLGIADDTPADPACSDRDAVAAGRATGGGHVYARAASHATDAVTGCYPQPGHPDRFSFVRLTVDERRVTVLGQSRILRNESLAAGGNAALALRTLGAHTDLRWYLPDPAELSETTEPSIGDLLPPWVRWVSWQLLVAAVVVLLWRGRRLGRVVPEPLPVVVRSAETVEGRARLYRTGRARGRAAAVLRTAAVRRLATRLGVPATAGPPDVAHLAAEATGADPGRVHQLLLGHPPHDDAALVALASALDDLEQAVARTSAGARYGDPARDQRPSAPAPAAPGGTPPGTPTHDGPDPEGGR